MALASNSIAQTWLDLAEENRGTDRFSISFAAFRSFLEGDAPTRDELAVKVPLEHDAALQLIATMVGEGRLRGDESRERVVGAGGLSLSDSPHSVTMNGRRFGVWCALDAVGIPAGLGVDATVESSCADTNDLVRIEMEGGRIIHQTPENVLIKLVPASVARSVFDTL